jgi:hypothetical protein
VHGGPADWGERLSDRVRRAIAAGDLESARRLTVEGDGQARSLEKEYALMYRGLGITLRVLVGLLADTVRVSGAAPRAALLRLLSRFRADMLGLMAAAYPPGTAGPAALSGAGGDLAEEIERTGTLLAVAEACFSREQSRLAAEVLGSLLAGDAAAARGALDRKERDQYLPLHDRMVRFMAESFGFVLDHFGAPALERFHIAAAEGQRRGFEGWEALGPAEFARATAFLLKQHMGEVEVREDAERFTIVQRPCGSGGRLRLAGAYAGPSALPMVTEPGAQTLGRREFPVYCSHCPIWNGLASVEWFGHPHWVFDDPARPDGSCTLHVYKDRDAAPADYYRRLGRTGGR